MGAALGALLALSVILAAAPIAHMIGNAAAPRLTMTIFIGAFAAMFAIGATLTGWIFIAMEER